MKRYEMSEESGASEIIEVDSLDEALDEARDWAADGSYDERCMVRVCVREVDDDGEVIWDGEHAEDEVAAGPEPRPPKTECGEEDEDHTWGSPHWLGGCDENPGVWSLGGTTIATTEVCTRCGIYKHARCSGAQRNPGELDEELSYGDADDRSLAWIEEMGS